MDITVTHEFVSGKADSADATLIQPSHWNDTHEVNVPLPVELGAGVPSGVPGSNNPYTAPHNLVITDGTTASPQTDGVKPTVQVQRTHGDPSNIGHCFVVDAKSSNAVSPQQGVIALTGVLSDLNIGRGGTAVRANVHGDQPPAISAIISATISGADVIIVTATPHYGHAGISVIIAGTTGITNLNSPFRNITQVDSATQFRISSSGLIGGPASGGTATMPDGCYALWSSISKYHPNRHMVGYESDFNNYAGDPGPEVANHDAVISQAIYIAQNNGTIALGIDSADGASGFYYPLRFGQKSCVEGYAYINTAENDLERDNDFAWIGNGQFIRWNSNGGASSITRAGKIPVLGVDTSNNTHLSADPSGVLALGVNLTPDQIFSTNKISFAQPITQTKVSNYISSETGANNAIAGALTNASGANIALADGLEVVVKLAHTLQAGANTFDLNATGAVGIRSSRNPGNNIGTAYASSGIIRLLYNGANWLDMSQ